MKWKNPCLVSKECRQYCVVVAGLRTLRFLTNESGILPRIKLPLKYVTLADKAELQERREWTVAFLYDDYVIFFTSIEICLSLAS